MLWYMIKTWADGEEALVKEIRRTVPPYMYQDVFLIFNERNWRHQGQSVIHVEPLFRGCVFLTCQETEPLFRRLERIPAMSRLISAGHLSMFPLMEQDARFLEEISGKDHVVRASYVLRESEESSIYRVSGPLESMMDNIEKIRFSSRIAKIRKMLWGEDVVIPLGFIVNEDIRQKVWYGDMQVTAELPDHYTLLEISKDEDGKNCYRAGSRVAAIPHEGTELPNRGSGLPEERTGRMTVAV